MDTGNGLNYRSLLRKVKNEANFYLKPINKDIRETEVTDSYFQIFDNYWLSPLKNTETLSLDIGNEVIEDYCGENVSA
jgi:hypothetical protein